jgi:hypothetical protein
VVVVVVVATTTLVVVLEPLDKVLLVLEDHIPLTHLTVELVVELVQLQLVMEMALLVVFRFLLALLGPLSITLEEVAKKVVALLVEERLILEMVGLLFVQALDRMVALES